MLIRNRWAAVIFKWLIFIAAFFAVTLQVGLFSGKLNLSVLTYFTLMTNVACMVYYPFAAIGQARTGHSPCPALKGALLMCVSVTGLVYHFMLHGRFEMQGTILLSNILLHYVVPVATAADWVLFDDKGFFDLRSAIRWLLAPVAYTIFVHIAVAMGAHLGPYGEKYPYFFMDVDAMGIPVSIAVLIGMAAGFFLLGLFWVWADRGLAKKAVKA